MFGPVAGSSSSSLSVCCRRLVVNEPSLRAAALSRLCPIALGRPEDPSATAAAAAGTAAGRPRPFSTSHVAAVPPPSRPPYQFVPRGGAAPAALSPRHQQHRRWLSDSTSSGSGVPPPEAAKKGQEGTEEEGAPAGEGETDPALADLQRQVDELSQQVSATKDQLLRSLAEQENIRTIARRDVESARQFSIKSFARSLLEVADNLDRALGHIDKTELETNPSLRTLYEGIDMTSTGLTKALESNGVKAYCHQPGDVFDPSLHEALMEYPDESKTPGTVGLVMKKGYTLNSRVLRPAEVGVIKK
jgi:molecular chaperone GrpE